MSLVVVIVIGCLVVWLNVFNAELSPKRYWRGPRSQEVGEEGDYIPNATLSPPGCDESCFNVSLTVKKKITRQCHTVYYKHHNF